MILRHGVFGVDELDHWEVSLDDRQGENGPAVLPGPRQILLAVILQQPVWWASAASERASRNKKKTTMLG